MSARPFLTLAAAAALSSIALAGQAGRSSFIRDLTDGRIYFLDIGRGGRVLSAAVDGSDAKVVVASPASGPDGIVVDPHFVHNGGITGRLYWTTMGRVNDDDGTIESADMDGSDLKTLVPSGGTFTPKQIKLDRREALLGGS